MTINVFDATPVISAAAIYASGDAVGTKLEFENVVSAFQPSGRIVGAVIIDRDKESDLLNLVLFDQDFTETADNSPMDPSDADLAHVVAIVPFPAANYVDLNDNSVGHAGTLDVPFVLAAGGTSLYGQLVSGATPTYTAVGDLTVRLFVES